MGSEIHSYISGNENVRVILTYGKESVKISKKELNKRIETAADKIRTHEEFKPTEGTLVHIRVRGNSIEAETKKGWVNAETLEPVPVIPQSNLEIAASFLGEVIEKIVKQLNKIYLFLFPNKPIPMSVEAEKLGEIVGAVLKDGKVSIKTAMEYWKSHVEKEPRSKERDELLDSFNSCLSILKELESLDSISLKDGTPDHFANKFASINEGILKRIEKLKEGDKVVIPGGYWTESKETQEPKFNDCLIEITKSKDGTFSMRMQAPEKELAEEFEDTTTFVKEGIKLENLERGLPQMLMLRFKDASQSQEMVPIPGMYGKFAQSAIKKGTEGLQANVKEASKVMKKGDMELKELGEGGKAKKEEKEKPTQMYGISTARDVFSLFPSEKPVKEIALENPTEQSGQVSTDKSLKKRVHTTAERLVRSQVKESKLYDNFARKTFQADFDLLNSFIQVQNWHSFKDMRMVVKQSAEKLLISLTGAEKEGGKSRAEKIGNEEEVQVWLKQLQQTLKLVDHLENTIPKKAQEESQNVKNIGAVQLPKIISPKSGSGTSDLKGIENCDLKLLSTKVESLDGLKELNKTLDAVVKAGEWTILSSSIDKIINQIKIPETLTEKDIESWGKELESLNQVFFATSLYGGDAKTPNTERMISIMSMSMHFDTLLCQHAILKGCDKKDVPIISNSNLLQKVLDNDVFASVGSKEARAQAEKVRTYFQEQKERPIDYFPQASKDEKMTNVYSRLNEKYGLKNEQSNYARNIDFQGKLPPLFSQARQTALLSSMVACGFSNVQEPMNRIFSNIGQGLRGIVGAIRRKMKGPELDNLDWVKDRPEYGQKALNSYVKNHFGSIPKEGFKIQQTVDPNTKVSLTNLNLQKDTDLPMDSLIIHPFGIALTSKLTAKYAERKDAPPPPPKTDEEIKREKELAAQSTGVQPPEKKKAPPLSFDPNVTVERLEKISPLKGVTKDNISLSSTDNKDVSNDQYCKNNFFEPMFGKGEEGTAFINEYSVYANVRTEGAFTADDLLKLKLLSPGWGFAGAASKALTNLNILLTDAPTLAARKEAQVLINSLILRPNVLNKEVIENNKQVVEEIIQKLHKSYTSSLKDPQNYDKAINTLTLLHRLTQEPAIKDVLKLEKNYLNDFFNLVPDFKKRPKEQQAYFFQHLFVALQESYPNPESMLDMLKVSATSKDPTKPIVQHGREQIEQAFIAFNYLQKNQINDDSRFTYGFKKASEFMLNVNLALEQTDKASRDHFLNTLVHKTKTETGDTTFDWKVNSPYFTSGEFSFRLDKGQFLEKGKATTLLDPSIEDSDLFGEMGLPKGIIWRISYNEDKKSGTKFTLYDTDLTVKGEKDKIPVRIVESENPTGGKKSAFQRQFDKVWHEYVPTGVDGDGVTSCQIPEEYRFLFGGRSMWVDVESAQTNPKAVLADPLTPGKISLSKREDVSLSPSGKGLQINSIKHKEYGSVVQVVPGSYLHQVITSIDPRGACYKKETGEVTLIFPKSHLHPPGAFSEMMAVINTKGELSFPGIGTEFVSQGEIHQTSTDQRELIPSGIHGFQVLKDVKKNKEKILMPMSELMPVSEQQVRQKGGTSEGEKDYRRYHTDVIQKFTSTDADIPLVTMDIETIAGERVLTSKDPATNAYMGYVYLTQKRDQEALAFFEKSITNNIPTKELKEIYSWIEKWPDTSEASSKIKISMWMSMLKWECAQTKDEKTTFELKPRDDLINKILTETLFISSDDEKVKKLSSGDSKDLPKDVLDAMEKNLTKDQFTFLIRTLTGPSTSEEKLSMHISEAVKGVVERYQQKMTGKQKTAHMGETLGSFTPDILALPLYLGMDISKKLETKEELRAFYQLLASSPDASMIDYFPALCTHIFKAKSKDDLKELKEAINSCMPRSITGPQFKSFFIKCLAVQEKRIDKGQKESTFSFPEIAKGIRSLGLLQALSVGKGLMKSGKDAAGNVMQLFKPEDESKPVELKPPKTPIDEEMDAIKSFMVAVTELADSAKKESEVGKVPEPEKKRPDPVSKEVGADFHTELQKKIEKDTLILPEPPKETKPKPSEPLVNNKETHGVYGEVNIISPKVDPLKPLTITKVTEPNKKVEEFFDKGPEIMKGKFKEFKEDTDAFLEQTSLNVEISEEGCKELLKTFKAVQTNTSTMQKKYKNDIYQAVNGTLPKEELEKVKRVQTTSHKEISMDRIVGAYAQGTKNLEALLKSVGRTDVDIGKLEKDIKTYMLNTLASNQAKQLVSKLEKRTDADLQDNDWKKDIYELALSEQHYSMGEPGCRPYLMLEYMKGFTLRKENIELARNLVNNPNSINKLPPGMGKTASVIPLFAALMAQKEGILATIVLPDWLYNANRNELDRILKDNFGIEQFCLEVPMSRELSNEDFDYFTQRCTDTIHQKGVMLTTRQSLQVLHDLFDDLEIKLKAAKSGSTEETAIFTKYQKLGTLLSILDDRMAKLTDEVDSINDLHQEVNKSEGEKAPVEPWKRSTALDIYKQILNADDIISQNLFMLKNALLQNTHVDLPPETKKEALKELVAGYVEGKNDEVKKIYTSYLLHGTVDKKELNEDNIPKIIADLAKSNPSEYEKIIALKVFISETLPNSCLVTGGGVKGGYGRREKWEEVGPHKLAGSEYSNEFELVGFTIQNYLQEGMNEPQATAFIEAIRAAIQKDRSVGEEFIEMKETPTYQRVLKEYGIDLELLLGDEGDIPKILAKLNDPTKLERRLTFCEEFVLPKLKYNIQQVSADAYDLDDMGRSSAGMTGTPYNKDTFSDKADLTGATRKGADGRTFWAVVKHADDMKVTTLKGTTQAEVRDATINLITEYDGIIDPGVYTKGKTTFEQAAQAAEAVEKSGDKVTKYILYNDGGDIYALSVENKTTQKFKSIVPPPDLGTYKTIYTDFIGVDIKQKPGAKFVLTIGNNLFTKDFIQAVMRLRELLKGQMFDVILTPEVEKTIRELLEKPEGKITIQDVIAYCEYNQDQYVQKDNLAAEKRKIERLPKQALFKARVRASAFATAKDIPSIKNAYEGRKKYILRETKQSLEDLAKVKTKIKSEESIEQVKKKTEETLKSILNPTGSMMEDLAIGMKKKVAEETLFNPMMLEGQRLGGKFAEGQNLPLQGYDEIFKLAQTKTMSDASDHLKTRKGIHTSLIPEFDETTCSQGQGQVVTVCSVQQQQQQQQAQQQQAQQQQAQQQQQQRSTIEFYGIDKGWNSLFIKDGKYNALPLSDLPSLGKRIYNIEYRLDVLRNVETRVSPNIGSKPLQYLVWMAPNPFSSNQKPSILYLDSSDFQEFLHCYDTDQSSGKQLFSAIALSDKGPLTIRGKNIVDIEKDIEKEELKALDKLLTAPANFTVEAEIDAINRIKNRKDIDTNEKNVLNKLLKGQSTTAENETKALESIKEKVSSWTYEQTVKDTFAAGAVGKLTEPNEIKALDRINEKKQLLADREKLYDGIVQGKLLSGCMDFSDENEKLALHRIFMNETVTNLRRFDKVTYEKSRDINYRIDERRKIESGLSLVGILFAAQKAKYQSPFYKDTPSDKTTFVNIMRDLLPLSSGLMTTLFMDNYSGTNEEKAALNDFVEKARKEGLEKKGSNSAENKNFLNNIEYIEKRLKEGLPPKPPEPKINWNE